jgi:SnoaL-like domain
MNQVDVEAQVQQLVDRNEIADLVYRLGVALDEGRFDEMRSLFIEEATARTPGGTAEGREALVAQASRNHDPDERIQHVTTNLLVELDGDRAKVRANLVVHFAPPADPQGSALAPPPRFTLGEVYRFEVVRTRQGWRFSRVETSPVWMSGSLDRGPRQKLVRG